jgi:hypothetical protein
MTYRLRALRLHELRWPSLDVQAESLDDVEHRIDLCCEGLVAITD